MYTAHIPFFYFYRAIKKLRNFTKNRMASWESSVVAVSGKVKIKLEGCYHCIRISCFLRCIISVVKVQFWSGKNHVVVLNPQRKGGRNYHNRPQRLNGNRVLTCRNLWLWLIDNNVSWHKVGGQSTRYHLICIIAKSLCLVNKNLN